MPYLRLRFEASSEAYIKAVVDSLIGEGTQDAGNLVLDIFESDHLALEDLERLSALSIVVEHVCRIACGTPELPPGFVLQDFQILFKTQDLLVIPEPLFHAPAEFIQIHGQFLSER